MTTPDDHYRLTADGHWRGRDDEPETVDGWTREWAVDRGRRGIDPYPTEAEARRQAALAALPVVTRLVGRWETAGRDGADRA